MSEKHRQIVGQVINGEFELRKYLGGSESKDVFLAGRRDSDVQMAIKLIAVDRVNPERQLSQWKLASTLSNPHLLRIFDNGRCYLNQSNFLYVVIEYAEENLSQILPQRPLTPAEARDMLLPTLDALAYLHAKSFVHGHVKPANIMAIDDVVKLSTDGLVSMRDRTPSLLYTASVYDPPEAASGALSTASDVWSLGMTLVEALTQRLPGIEKNSPTPVSLPENLPAPFAEIVRGCLIADPARRSTVAQIAAQLTSPASISQSAASTPVMAVPSPAAPPPAIRPPAAPPRPAAFSLQGPPASSDAKQTPAAVREKIKKRGYLIPVVAATLVLAAIFGGARLLNRHEAQSVWPAAPSSPATSSPSYPPGSSSDNELSSASQPLAHSTQQKNPPRSKSFSATASSDLRPGKQAQSQASRNSGAMPAVPFNAAVKTSGNARVPGEVLQQSLPDISTKAKDSIRGKVRIEVKVHVDSSGSVTGAELISPGPSKYFADLTMKSARRWEFTPAKINGQYVPSEWILRYEFTNSGVRAYSEETAP
jgi:TonB family protein